MLRTGISNPKVRIALVIVRRGEGDYDTDHKGLHLRRNESSTGFDPYTNTSGFQLSLLQITSWQSSGTFDNGDPKETAWN